MTETLDPDDSWDELLLRISQAWNPGRWRDLGVVIGCSGGADSIGLMTAMQLLRQQPDPLGQPPGAKATSPPRGFLVAAHYNHALRGKESDADEAFVRQLARQFGMRFVGGRAITAHRDEATMRRERMQFLIETAQARGARYIALAHTADDNVETVLHHLLRGTGPAGLAGIGSPRDVAEDLVLIRPLLRIGRGLVRRGLRAAGQSWREDASNDDTRYRRNWIRHRLLPLVESEYPGAAEAIGRAIDSQRDWRSLIDRLARNWLESHRQSDDPLTLRRDSRTQRPIIIAAAQIAWTELGWPRGEMSHEHWTRLATTIESQVDQRYTMPGNIDVSTTGEEVRLRRADP